MASKKVIRVSDDNVTFYSVPATTMDLTVTTEATDDSILGQTFTSQFPSLATWEISSDAISKGVSGYEVDILKTGTPTATTGEVMSLVSGLTYETATESRNLWDYNATTTIYDDGTPVDAADIESINYLLGRVTFVSGYVPAGAITADFSYMSTSSYGCFNSMTLTQTQDANDDTCFQDARLNNGLRTNVAGMRTVSLSASGYRRAGFDPISELLARDVLVLEIRSDEDGYSKARGYFTISSATPFSGAVGENDQTSVEFMLYVPSSDFLPFAWTHDLVNTNLSQAVLIILDAFANQTDIYVELLPNGVADRTGGWTGAAVVTDASLESSVEGTPVFSFTSTGSGALTPTT